MTNYTQKFNKIKKYLNDNSDKLEYINGYYYQSKAVKKVKKCDYFLNSYYDLTISDFLTMVKYNDNLKQVKRELLNDYIKWYALAIYDNFKAILKEV